MKKMWVHKTSSFKKAKDFDEEYYFNMSSAERMDMVQFLREQYFKLKGRPKDEGRKGLRRSIKIIQLRKRLSKKDLIKIKKISGREQDKVDLKILTRRG